MEGMGIYQWNDGRKYMGYYKDDKKHGFGIYVWADHRKYEGYWVKGKQHGLGMYHVPKEEKVKHGLWEDGKRIEWFDDKNVTLIDSHELDYTSYFRQQGSEQFVSKAETFLRPAGFNERLDEVKKKIAQLRAKTMTSIGNDDHTNY
jgi:hypothetical protein